MYSKTLWTIIQQEASFQHQCYRLQKTCECS
jgi:hypothetical protein